MSYILWRAAQLACRFLAWALRRAEATRIAAMRAHLERRPLDRAAKDRVRDAYASGKPLCCTGGREVLRGAHLDACWVEVLNTWAYGTLGCYDAWQPGGSLYEHGVGYLAQALGRAPGDWSLE